MISDMTSDCQVSKWGTLEVLEKVPFRKELIVNGGVRKPVRRLGSKHRVMRRV